MVLDLPAPPPDALEQMLEMARRHGEDGPVEDGATHEVGDLQQLVQEMWGLLSEGERESVWARFMSNFDDEDPEAIRE